MKQQLSIARALLHEPCILFLDEPTKGLDPMALKTVHNLLKVQLGQQKKITIFMTTHRLDEAEKLCDRVAIMHQGKILADGAITNLREELGLTGRYQITAVDVNRDISTGIERYFRGAKTILFDNDNNMIKFEINHNGKNLETAIDLIRSNGGTIMDIRHMPVSLESIYEAIIYSRKQP
jgi:ABC-2 type transport system ATP-binding protein